MDLRRIYEYALQREKEGLRFFSENAQRAGHASVAEVFTRLAQEERAHIEFIEKILAGLARPGAGAVVSPPPDATAGIFARAAVTELLEQTTSEAMVPDLPVLRLAYLIERDLAEFYRNSAAQATGEAARALLLLADWETGHEALFKGLHDRAFQEYAGMPWGG